MRLRSQASISEKVYNIYIATSVLLESTPLKI